MKVAGIVPPLTSQFQAKMFTPGAVALALPAAASSAGPPAPAAALAAASLKSLYLDQAGRMYEPSMDITVNLRTRIHGIGVNWD